MPLQIEYASPESLKPHERNARKHPKKQLRQLAGSIKAFGFISPVLVNAEGLILAGHGRVDAAKLAGLDKIPTVRDAALRRHPLDPRQCSSFRGAYSGERSTDTTFNYGVEL